MKRYFSIIEEVRIKYECRPTPEQEELIEKMGFQEWLEATPLGNIFEVSSHEEIYDYLHSDQDTICEE